MRLEIRVRDGFLVEALAVRERKACTDGHWERLRARYQLYGKGALQDYELPELLLTFAIPRRDAEDAAYSRNGTT